MPFHSAIEPGRAAFEQMRNDETRINLAWCRTPGLGKVP
jgi:hypothetical protein